MKIQVLANSDSVAKQAAKVILAKAVAAVAARGRFVMAFSGGHTPWQILRALTLTYPMLNRSRRILWLVTGPEKAKMLARLERGDPSIPAGRIRQDAALVLADRAAAGNANQD